MSTADGVGGPGGDPRGGDLVVTVDRHRCVGTGLCAATAPDDLTLGTDGRALPRRPSTALSEELAEAAEMCPVEAIAVLRPATGEQVAPAY
ncbi:ferredoxin [Kitasatospora sp. NPDC048540]|uniref:ferredoxin n=1 Tax=Kitasatospora sp. NPDC048540 TaxID=3155634 RepID=UPI0033E19A6B